MTSDEAKLLLEGLRMYSLQLYEISLLSLYFGLRAGEIFNLCWSDVDLNNHPEKYKEYQNKKRIYAKYCI